jgi:tetratricopeptide (TPR) repeat protein
VLAEGRLAPGVFPDVLRHLYLERRTGLFHVTRADESCSVCFVSGRIAWGQSTLEECRLGPVLVRHGLLPQEVLDQVYELVGGGKRLGELLVELGALSRETLDEALALQVREALLAVFAWQDGRWRFEEHTPEAFKGYDRALAVSTEELILDAVWSVPDPDVIRYALGELERPLALASDPLRRCQRLTLGHTDGKLLSLADGFRSANDVLALSEADPREAQRSLLGLLCAGVLEWRPARSRAAPAPSLPLVAPLAAPAATPGSAPELDFREAEQVLAGAEGEFAAGRYWDALQAVEAVLDGLGGKLRTRALLLRARVYARNPKWLRQAEQLLIEVVAADPANAEAYFELGLVYRSAGVVRRADAMFRRVLELKPRHAGARRQLESAA